jgi:hypothetical protein
MKWLIVPLLLCLTACPEPKPMPDPDLPAECPETPTQTCFPALCGEKLNACGQRVSCGTCEAGQTCTGAGVCEATMMCVPDVMGACAGRCGPQADGCGGTVQCSPCVVDAGVDAGLPTLRCPVMRSSIDRPDESSLPQVRLMYVLPSDATDESLDVNGRICQSARAFTGWLAAQLGGSTLRLDSAQGELDIGFVRLTKTNAQLRGTGNTSSVDTGIAYVRERIERELVAGNQVKPDKLYAVFYGGESSYACGGAAYPPALIGSVIAMYLKSTVGGVACESRPWGQGDGGLGYYDWAMLHDLFHGLGIVPAASPNHHSFGHAFDVRSPTPNVDLMYSPRAGMNDPYWNVDADGGLVLDLNRDDYFAHDGGWVDVRKSAFLEPLPMNAMRPPGW